VTDDFDQLLGQLGESLGELADAGQEELARQLAALVSCVASEAARRKSFGKAMLAALTPRDRLRVASAPSGSHRRKPGLIDPFELYRVGESELRNRLATLDVEQLKDVIAEHGMDRDKLAMKWKTPARLIERIVETVRSRSAKGDVFLR
jgi:hypothetical protein